MVSVFSVLGLVMTASPAGAALSITAPAAKNLGTASVAGGSKATAQLGTVRVDASGIVAPSFVATVTSTTFKTGGGTASETIGRANVSYWSGAATASSGAFLTLTPGQPNAATAQDLSVARVAFSGTGLALSVSVSWNPTLTVTVPAGAVAGAYSGTVTHSVA